MSIQEPWEFEYKRQRRAKRERSERPIWQILYDEVVQLTEREMCDHKFAKVFGGSYKLCKKCAELRGPFKAINYESNDYERILFRNTGPDRTKEVRDTFREMLLSLSLSHSHVDELCLICEKYDRTAPVRCRTRSLCAAILRQWMSEDLSVVDKMSLREFSKKCGVSKCTITKVCKQINNK